VLLPPVIGARNFAVNSSSILRGSFPFTGNEIQGRFSCGKGLSVRRSCLACRTATFASSWLVVHQDL
jgi:hypothetical protein